jgi:hypothetical protein
MVTSKILTAVIPSGYSPNIISTSYGIEPIRQNRSKMNILWRSIQRKNKIKNIWKIDGIV